MSAKINKGDRLVLHLNSSEVFEGTVQAVYSNSIELTNINNLKNATAIPGNMTFYRSEISRFAKTEEKNDMDSGASCGSSEADDTPAIKMDVDEYARLQAMINNYKYILHKDDQYKAALNRLKSVESIGVAGLGKPLSLVAISTWSEVFIFDVTRLGFDGLKPILESEDICKVLHGGTELHRCFCHTYNVEMKNIFDTQIADSHLSKHDGTPRNLAECTNFNLNFPLALLEPAMEHHPDHDYWNTRPIIKVGKIMASQLVVYLITLRDYFQAQMLKDVFDTVKSDFAKVRNIDNLTMIRERLKLVSHRS